MTLMLSTDYMSYREVESKIMTLYSYFNGKVNKILPATELNFSNSQYIPIGSCDRTTGAILFSLPKMVEMVNNRKYKDIALLYAVIHELSHMDQYWIGDKYVNDKEYTNHIETANTRRTLEFIYENTTILKDVYEYGDNRLYEDMCKEYNDIKTKGYSFDYITPHIVLDEIVKFMTDNQENYDDYNNIFLSILNYQSFEGQRYGMLSNDFGFTVKGEDALDYRTQFRILADVRKAFSSFSYECRCYSKDMYGLLKFASRDIKKINVVQQM